MSFNYEQLKGKYVIVRSYNEGVNAGYVVSAAENAIQLRKARRLWYHAPKDKDLSWYEGVALTGLRDDSRVSPPVEKIIQENYSVTFCTEEARESIEAFPSNPQS